MIGSVTALTWEKWSGTGRWLSEASRMPLSQRARKCSHRTRSTHLRRQHHQYSHQDFPQSTARFSHWLRQLLKWAVAGWGRYKY